MTDHADDFRPEPAKCPECGGRLKESKEPEGRIVLCVECDFEGPA